MQQQKATKTKNDNNVLFDIKIRLLIRTVALFGRFNAASVSLGCGIENWRHYFIFLRLYLFIAIS